MGLGFPPLASTKSRNLLRFRMPHPSAQTPVSLHHWIHPSSLPRYCLTADKTLSKSSRLRIRSWFMWAGSAAETRIRNDVVSIEFTVVNGSCTPVSFM